MADLELQVTDRRLISSSSQSYEVEGLEEGGVSRVW